MLLNLGLTADAAAAHTHDSSPPVNSPVFSLSALPLLSTFYKPKQADGSGGCPGLISGLTSAMGMSPVESAESEGEASQPQQLPVRPRTSRATSGRKSTRLKTTYQFAHPASHARHKRLRLRPKLLLQLQQVSQTPRPLPVVDILPSTSYLPLLARKFPAIYRTRNGLGPYDLIVVISEQYERTVTSIPEKHVSSEDETDDHREVVATICQKTQEDARLKGKAEICLNFGPVWEATPLPSGSYEFVAQTDNGAQVVRWALRSGRNRRMTAPAGMNSRDEGKRFTFSVLDPTTRRHPVIASMTRNQLEVHDEYSMTTRTGTGPTTPTSAMSVVSDASDDMPLDANIVTLEDELRTLIITTGVWVAFREGWSHNFSYGDPISSGARSVVSPASSRAASPTVTRNDHDPFPDNDEASPTKGASGKRCMSISGVRRSNTTAAADDTQYGSLSKRSNSTGAAFMERAKRRSASGLSTRLNRHSMFTTGEHGRDIVVSRSRPASLRQNSSSSEEPSHLPIRSKTPTLKPEKENTKPTRSDKDISSSTPHQAQKGTRKEKPEPSKQDIIDPTSKPKRRHRLSTFFHMFSRKHDIH